jgi:hypothetical protein
MPSSKSITRLERKFTALTNPESGSATAASKSERSLGTITEDVAGEGLEPPSPISWQHMMKAPSVAQALKDHEAAQVAIAASNKTPPLTKSVLESKGSAQQSFESKQPPKMIAKACKATGQDKEFPLCDETDRKKQVPSSPSVEDASDYEDGISNLGRTDTGLFTAGYFDKFGSVSPASDQGDYSNDHAPLFSFSRRLSSAAFALANRDYASPASDSSGETEEIPRPDLEDIDSPAEAKAMILKSMNMFLEKFQGPQQATQELVVKNQLAIQELATRISTTPPTLPVVVQPQFDLIAFENVVKACVEESALQAYQAYSNYFNPGSHTHISTTSKERLPRQPRWTCAALQEHPKVFWSTAPRACDWTIRLRASGAKWSAEQMYICLKNDESRYLGAVRNCLFLRNLEHGYRYRDVPSWFPWNEQNGRKHHIQQDQQKYNQPQTRFCKFTVLSGAQNFAPATMSQLGTQTRKASWLMDDIEYGGGQIVQQ